MDELMKGRRLTRDDVVTLTGCDRIEVEGWAAYLTQDGDGEFRIWARRPVPESDPENDIWVPGLAEGERYSLGYPPPYADTDAELPDWRERLWEIVDFHPPCLRKMPRRLKVIPSA